MGSWRDEPMILRHWDPGWDYVMSVDENGTHDLEWIHRRLLDGLDVPIQNQVLTITGVIQDLNAFRSFREEVRDLKLRHWPNGLWHYKGSPKSVCLHSREIRKKDGPFSTAVIDHDKFMVDLSSVIDRTDTTILSASINKVHLVRKYVYPEPPYRLALGFIVERFCRRLNRENAQGALVLESCGRSQDIQTHGFLMSLLGQGTRYMHPSEFACLKGIFFNPKWNPATDRRTFPTLELADLCSYPIHRHVRGLYDEVSKSQPNPSFEVIEKKLDRYPNYLGYGLKVFP